jgi:long-chain acyl-CoA synthetase
MITNRNVVAVVAGVVDAIPDTNKNDAYLSYLPLAHILERAAEAYIISRGGRIGFFQGDLRKLTDDIKQLQPTVYAGVPKVFQRIMNEVKKQIHEKGAVARILFSICYSLKRKFRLVGLPTGIFDTIIFNKTKLGLGGKVKTIVSGGAPLPKECHEFLTICFGTTIQGYGLTETCGGATITPLDYPSPWERAGAPISSSEIKLVSAGKYSTASNPPQGELCVKGDNISLGYYEMPDKTKEDFVVEDDGERWFHTGDVGRRNADGTFSIVGRVKDIFKLDGGEYIAPERLESIYAQSKFISNIFVWGDSYKSFIVAVAVPEFEAAKRWAAEHGVKINPNAQPPNCPEELVNNAELKKAIIADFKRIALEAKLNRYEELPVIELDGLFWTPDTGLVTDALKNKRDPLYAKYQDKITAMYESNNFN